jgi:DNA-binding NarL/FixJ family response regulator
MARNKRKDGANQKTRILLVDDHEVVRYGIGQLINKQPDLIVCGEAEDAGTGFKAIATTQADFVIVDITLKESSGLELIKNIKVRYPKLPILVISMHDEALYAELALRAGARGYLMKEEAISDVLTAIRRVLDGGLYLSERLSGQLIEQRIRGEADLRSSPLQRLSNRELEVFFLIGQWKRTSQIAKELSISIKTVEYYREQIKEKLNLGNAIELAQYAVEWSQRTAQKA